jgi:hypothetical protein
MAQKEKAKGAMAKSPSGAANRQAAAKKKELARVSPGVYRNKEGQRVNASGQRIDERGRVLKIEAKPPATPPPAAAAEQSAVEQQPSAPTVEQNLTGGLGQQLGYLQQQGAFQPGDFGQQMEGAYQNVMQNFQRTMEPQFARQQADFRQMAAERGLDPNSEAYRALQEQVNLSQESARLGAMSQAQQAAQAVQQQGFTQAATQYSMPATMMGAFAPFYGEMGEQQRFGQGLTWEQQKLAEQHRQAMEQLRLQGQLQRSMPRGDPNALTYQQRLELMDREMANRAAIQGLQNPQQQQSPSTGNAFQQGAAQGVGTAIQNQINR